VLTSGIPYARAFAENRFPGTLTFLSGGSVKVTDLTPPAAPTGLAVTNAGGGLLVRWDPSPAGADVTRYLVRWGKANNNSFIPEEQRIVTAGGETRMRIGAVKVGQPYGIDITALDASNNVSNLSAPVYATPIAANDPVPLAPTSFQQTAQTGSSAGFSWAQGPGAAPAFYRLVYVKLGATVVTSQTDVVGAGSTSVTINNLETGAAYDVRLYAGNADGWLSAATTTTLRAVVSNRVDADGDGMPEDWAAANGVSDGAGDRDGDGLTNAAEYVLGTQPRLQDSDGDGYSDGEEQAAGSDALDGSSYGGVYLQPRLALDDDQLHFVARLQPGGAPSPQSVTWSNVGGGQGNLNLQASSPEAWITPSVSGDKVQVAISTGGLKPGFYSGIVRLNVVGSLALMGDPTCIRVNTWVQPADDDIAQRQAQTIDFGPLPNKRLGDPPFSLSASASSGLPVSFAGLEPAVCKVSGVTVTLVSEGQCSIAATQTGNNMYYPAQTVIRSFTVLGSPQQMPYKIYAPMINK
jgi:hypothetical protein